MFVAHEVPLPLDIQAASVRLLAFLRLDGLQDSSQAAFDLGRGMLMSAGIGAVSKQVRVQLLRPYRHEGVLIVPLRWVATGPSGTMFPQLDGNLELAPVDEDQSTLRLNGAYRPPLATVGARLDQLLLHHVADATIHRLLQDIAAAIKALPEASLVFDTDRHEAHGIQPWVWPRMAAPACTSRIASGTRRPDPVRASTSDSKSARAPASHSP